MYLAVEKGNISSGNIHRDLLSLINQAKIFCELSGSRYSARVMLCFFS